MARIAIPLLVTTLVVVLVTCLMVEAKEQPCKATAAAKSVKKFDPTSPKLSAETGSVTSDSAAAVATSSGQKKSGRSPRQTINEQRQYYPCMTCFRLGSREVCTNPYCPSDDFQCDKSSKRCHKKARVGVNRVQATVPEEPAPAEEN